MKLIRYMFIFTVVIAMSISCKKDFLTVANKNDILRQAYVVDLKTTDDFLKGLYIQVVEMFNYTGLNYSEVAADNIKPLDGVSFFGNYYNWNQLADDSRDRNVGLNTVNANGFWNVGVIMGRGCSFVIESAEKFKGQDPQLADNLKGQAYALRALTHFVMVNVFAQSYGFTADASHPGVPYTSQSDWTNPATRLSVAKVYETLINDLNTAIHLLPESQNTPSAFRHSKISKTAVKAILSRIYLNKGDWQQAKNLAREVINIVPIMSIGQGYPAKLFTNDESEAIFQLPPSSINANGDIGNFDCYFNGAVYGGAVHVLGATNDIASIVTENPADVRNGWVIKNGTNWDIKKYPSNVIPGFDIPEASYFQTLLRSSEMYLTAAECYANLNNKDSAIFYLDAIRTRAFPTATPTTATGSALLDSIYKERRKELAFEGLRMFDIQRLKQDIKRTDGPLDALHLPYGSDKAIAPIPTSDVIQAGMPQNPGY